MAAFQIYEEIQAFKASGTAVRDKVNYACVVAPFLYDMSLKGIIKNIVFSLFFSTHITEKKISTSNLLLYYSLRYKRRPDYDYIPQRIREILGTDFDYVETTERLSLGQFFRTVKVLRWGWRATRGYKAGWLRRGRSAFLIAKYRSTGNCVFSSLLLNKSKLVTFCDAQAPENLITQMAISSGVKTYTNQHGQYRILDASNISPDAEAYANFVSDYMFCWGEATRREFVRFGYKPEQFIITGWLKQWPYIAPHSPSGTFGVMLNGENARDSNTHLIEAAKTIASLLGIRYVVRLHPWSNREQYLCLIDSRCDAIGHFGLSPYLEKVDFSLAHMTGATIEALHAGSLVYLLDDGKLASTFCLEGLSFKTAKEIAIQASNDLSEKAFHTTKHVNFSHWFNDDSEQETRIHAALIEEKR